MSFARNLSDEYEGKILDTATKTEFDAAKTASKKLVSKAAEATGKLMGNKIAEKCESKTFALKAPFKNDVTIKMSNFRPLSPYITVSHFFQYTPSFLCHQINNNIFLHERP